jgi:hypothetical protein
VTETKRVPVVVTTEHRGVFFGWREPGPVFLHPADAKAMTLTDAQMCVYWAEDVKGVLGLASHGPTRHCKVTRPVASLTVTEVTGVLDASDEAVKSWADRPWS